MTLGTSRLELNVVTGQLGLKSGVDLLQGLFTNILEDKIPQAFLGLNSLLS